MPLPFSHTIVTYPDGETAGTATVRHAEPVGDGLVAVVLDSTPFHPVDTAWPDQPADLGVLETPSGAVPVVNALIGAAREGELRIGAEAPVRIGEPGWAFCVVHLVAGRAPRIGDAVRAVVDPVRRTALSAGHTACHLAALALDRALAGRWTKEVARDSLGSPAFDALAIQRSEIEEFGAIDVYRIGKSLRRRGFRADDVGDTESLASVEDEVNAVLAEWVASDARVGIERESAVLPARRTWVCDLPEGRAEIACGGTHAARLGELRAQGGRAAVRVSLEAIPVTGGIELIMRTRVGT